MARTIREMAALAFPTIGEDDKEALEALKYIGIECDNAHEYNSVRLNQQDLYIMGARAVVNEIEQCLPNTPFANPYEVIDIIASKIKELKEE